LLVKELNTPHNKIKIIVDRCILRLYNHIVGQPVNMCCPMHFLMQLSL
jgi:hypothetical protein